MKPHTEDSPYRGLNPFLKEHHLYFRGREGWSEAIIDSLIVSRLTVLCGGSGAGKTSLLRAGVEHNLIERCPKAAWAGYKSRPPTPELAVIVFPSIEAQSGSVAQKRSWSDSNPLNSLMQEINEQLDNIAAASKLSQDRDFVRFLQKSTERIGGRYASGKLYVILDQFEQYLEYHPSEEKGEGSFDEEFPKAVNRLNLDTHFLIVIRGDQLARLDRFVGSIPRLFDNLWRLKHLDLKSAKAAIEEPIRIYNERHLSPQQVKIRSDLVEEVLQKVQKDQGLGQDENAPCGSARTESSEQVGPPIETAYLQLVMDELWKRRKESPVLDKALLEECGGVDGIAKKLVETNLEKLPYIQKRAMAEAFRYLITPSGIRLSQSLPDLHKSIDVDITEEELSNALESLVEARILSSAPIPYKPGNDPIPGYEIIHDLLAKALLAWIGQYRRQHDLHLAWVIPSLAAQAIIQHSRWRLDEQALLLALHAYCFNKKGDGRFLAQVDHALRTVLNRDHFCRVLKGHRQGVVAVALSPDGKWLATGGFDNSLRLWDLHNKGYFQILKPQHEDHVWSVAFSQDSRKLASGSQDKTIHVFEITEAGEIKLFRNLRLKNEEHAVVWSIAFNHDGKYLASGHGDRKIRLWNLQENDPSPEVLPELESNVRALAFSPQCPKPEDSNKLIAGIDNGDLKLWWNPFGNTLADKRPSEYFDNMKRAITSVAFSRFFEGEFENKQIIAYSNKSGRIKYRNVYNFNEEKDIHELKAGTSVRSISISQDGRQLATSSEDGTVRLWSLSQLPDLPGLEGHSSRINAVAYGPAYLSSASDNGTVRLWELKEPEAQPQKLKWHTRRVSTLAFSPDGKRLASGSSDNKDARVILWNEKWEPRVVFNGQGQGIGAVAFSTDSLWFAVGSHDTQVRLGDQNGQDLKLIGYGTDKHQDIISSLAFSPIGPGGKCTWLASGSPDKKIKLWNLEQGCSGPSLTAGNGVNTLAFGPPGPILVAACQNGNVYLWESPFNEPKQVEQVLAEKGEGEASALALSNDGRWLAFGGKNGVVYLLDLSAWKQGKRAKPIELRGHELGTQVNVLSFSSDGQMLASGGSDHMICLWNPSLPKNLPVVLGGHEAAVHTLAFSPSDNRLASGGDDNQILLWIARTDDLAKIAHDKIWRDDLNDEEWLRFVGEDIPGKDIPFKPVFSTMETAKSGNDCQPLSPRIPVE